MNGGSVRSLRSALPVFIVAACGTGPREVAIDRIEPAAATNAQPTPVQLTGSFSLDITNDLDTGKTGVATVAVAIDSVPLADVVWLGNDRIDATIPAGIDPGLHDISVTIGGRRGLLDDGFAITSAGLVSTLSLPPFVGRGNPLVVTMEVTNTGVSATDAVAPSDLIASGTGAATVATPPTGPVSLTAGASTTFTWTYATTTVGMLTLAGTALGTDALTGFAIQSPVTQASTMIVEATTVVGDPLGDASPFGYVVGYQGHVYVGPNKTGASAVRLLPDGTGLSNLTFSFARDIQGNQASSSASAPYTSIGYTGCTQNTLACGPDNEDGRGLMLSGTLGGTEWLVLGGARSSGDLDYIYMTSDTDTTLDFKYVDLGTFLGVSTHGISAAHFLGNRLYMGFSDTSGAKPYFVALQATPTGDGIDTSGQDVINLGGDAFPDFAATTPAMIDSFGELNGRLYVANQSGLFAATVATPGVYNTTDWQGAKPAFSQWFNKTSRQPVKEADLFPADRAIPQFATFKGRLFFGRNTTTGPQLWACNPAGGFDPMRCEGGDWLHAAPNNTGDSQLTQFNNPALTSITMVVATPTHLYVGFDSTSGVQVFRTTMFDNLLPGNFEGTGGCDASMHPTFCQGLGGTGLGDATDTRILDAKALTFSGVATVWVTVGDGTGALRLVVLP